MHASDPLTPNSPLQAMVDQHLPSPKAARHQFPRLPHVSSIVPRRHLATLLPRHCTRDPLSGHVLAMGAEEGVAEDGGEPGRLEQRQPVGGEAHLRDKAMW